MPPHSATNHRVLPILSILTIKYWNLSLSMLPSALGVPLGLVLEKSLQKRLDLNVHPLSCHIMNTVEHNMGWWTGWWSPTSAALSSKQCSSRHPSGWGRLKRGDKENISRPLPNCENIQISTSKEDQVGKTRRLESECSQGMEKV